MFSEGIERDHCHKIGKRVLSEKHLENAVKSSAQFLGCQLCQIPQIAK